MLVQPATPDAMIAAASIRRTRFTVCPPLLVAPCSDVSPFSNRRADFRQELRGSGSDFRLWLVGNAAIRLGWVVGRSIGGAANLC